MKNKINIIFLFFVYFIQLSCGGNFLKDLSKKDSKEALYEDALLLVDKQKYQDAIDKISLITDTEYLARSDVKTTLIGAYAGLCGLNFIDFFTAVSATSSLSLFKMLTAPFSGKTVIPAACDTAQSLMEAQGTVGSRSNDQKLFMAILGMVKMGVNFRDRLDVDDGVGDGTIDAGIQVCTNGTSTGQISDDQLKKVVVGFGLLLENFAGLTASLSGTSSATITALEAQCTSLGISCNITSESSVTAGTLTAFRYLMDSSSYGFRSCDISTPLLCCLTP
ncbi:MAG: hypothetical protein ACOYOK_00440 [Pseudobdellovibrionaceae bacterium]